MPPWRGRPCALVCGAQGPDKNQLRVVQGHDHPWLLSHALLADQVSWVAGHAPAEGKEYGSKTRYRQPDSPALISQATDAGFRLDFPRRNGPSRPVSPPCSMTARSAWAAASSRRWILTRLNSRGRHQTIAGPAHHLRPVTGLWATAPVVPWPPQVLALGGFNAFDGIEACAEGGQSGLNVVQCLRGMDLLLCQIESGMGQFGACRRPAGKGLP